MALTAARKRPIRRRTRQGVVAVSAMAVLIGLGVGEVGAVGPQPHLVDWAAPVAHGSGSTGGNFAVAADPRSGDAFVAGIFDGSAAFGQGEQTVTLVATTIDGFLARYAGGELVWASPLGGSGSGVGLDVAVEPTTGDVLMTGLIEGSVTFGSGDTQVTVVAEVVDGFLARYTSDGDLVWVTLVTGHGNAELTSVAADPVSGEITVAGTFYGTVHLGESADQVTFTTHPQTMIVARYASDGALLWAEHAGRTGTIVQGEGAAVDPATGDVVVTGTFDVSARFGRDADAITLTSPYDQDAFLARYDAKGGLKWVTAEATGTKRALMRDVGIDPNTGHIVVAGSHEGAATFGQGTAAVTVGQDSPVTQGGFVARYDNSGALQWATGSTGSATIAMAVDPSTGDVAIAGAASGSVTVGEGDAAVTLPGEMNEPQSFWARYDSAGTPTWATRASGSSSQAMDVALDGSGALLTAGSFTHEVTFGESGDTVTLSTTGTSDYDGFLVRFAPEPDPAEQVADVQDTLRGMEVHHGTSNALNSKLANAFASLQAGDTVGACGPLGAFLNQVAAQTGKKLTAAQVEELAAAVTQIRTVLNC